MVSQSSLVFRANLDGVGRLTERLSKWKYELKSMDLCKFLEMLS